MTNQPLLQRILLTAALVFTISTGVSAGISLFTEDYRRGMLWLFAFVVNLFALAIVYILSKEQPPQI